MTTALFSLEIVGCIVYLNIFFMFKNCNRLGKACIAIKSQGCENEGGSDETQSTLKKIETSDNYKILCICKRIFHKLLKKNLFIMNI